MTFHQKACRVREILWVQLNYFEKMKPIGQVLEVFQKLATAWIFLSQLGALIAAMMRRGNRAPGQATAWKRRVMTHIITWWFEFLMKDAARHNRELNELIPSSQSSKLAFASVLDKLSLDKPMILEKERWSESLATFSNNLCFTPSWANQKRAKEINNF